MSNKFTLSLLVMVLSAGSTANAVSQQEPELVGVWEGRVHQAESELEVTITITTSRNSTLTGTADIPAQGASSRKLINIQARDQYFSFGIDGVKGNPLFDGAVSVNGNQLAGRFSQYGTTSPFDMQRKMAPESKSGDKSRLQGTWTGILDAGSLKLHLSLTIQPEIEGGVKMTMENPGRSARELPVTLDFQENEIRINLSSLSAFFVGTLKDEMISGTWRQGDARLPLSLEKSD